MSHALFCVTWALMALVISCTTENDRCRNERIKESREDSFAATGADLLTLDVQQTLLNNADDFGNIGDIVAVYRQDLDDNYAAYVEVTFPENNTYMLLSTGPATGDYRLQIQGQLPSLSERVTLRAREEGKVCVTYTMLTPELMACNDIKGNTVASNIPVQQWTMNMTLVDYMESHWNELVRMWQNLRRSTSDEWHTSRTMTEDELQEWWRLVSAESSEDKEEEVDELDEESLNDLAKPVLLAQSLTTGDAVDIALGHPNSLDFVEIRSVKVGKNESQHQELLCEIVKICNTTDNVRVSGENIKCDDRMGLFYMRMEVGDTSKMKDQGLDELDLVIVVHMKHSQVVMQRYGLDPSPPREKRGTHTRNHRAWTEKHIPCSQSYFPDYNQHQAGRCAVGCGPVAWAMVFGFYDRASHGRCGRYSNKADQLYRCSSEGIQGSSTCVAPIYNIPEGYTEELNDVMRTFCFSKYGATLAGRMNDVASFFRTRVSGGSIHTKKCFFYLLVRYCRSTRNWAKDKVDAGWPVVIGFRVSQLRWHYPVATGYRSKSHEERRCFIFCGRWKTKTESQWYLHMGWGPNTREWRAMDAYAAWTAQF